MNPKIPPFDFTNRTVIVTGGTKGLGRAIASHFLATGADVVLCARREPDTPVQFGDRTAQFVAADVRDADQIQAVVDAAMAATGRVDVLVNNAGGAPPADSATSSPRFNEKIVALNLLAPLAFAQAVHPVMTAQPEGGVIINISSVAGARANPSGAAYGAAKAGLDNLTETLAHEWGPAIRVLSAMVGLIVSEEAQSFYGNAGIEAVGNVLAAKRMGDINEVANVVLFLASPYASWMTGAVVPIHGGGEQPAYLQAAAAAGRSEPNGQ